MNPERGIARTNIWSDNISTIPDGPNTLTWQSAGVTGFRYSW